VARLFTSGFEIADNTGGHEWTNAGVSSAARSTTSPRTGLACGLVSGLVSATQAGWGCSFITTADGGPYFLRFYLAVDTTPSADNCVAALVTGANVTSTSANDAQIRLTSSRTLRLFAANSAVGSASAALTAATYHLVELEVDNTPGAGSKIVRAYLDGSQFAGATTSSDVGGNISGLAVGGNLLAEAQTTGAWRFDDVAVNDSSGSAQTGLAGAGGVIILRPDAAGDSNAWNNTANGAGDANNYTLVDETSPDDATTMVQSATLNNTDLYNMGASGIGAGDTVNAVSVYLRRRNNVADASTAVAVVVRKTTGGTDGVGTAVVPNTTTWRTGNTTSSTVLTPSHVLYLDPDAGAWTQATLDTMQAGCRITTGGTNRVQVSALWVYVDYTMSSSVDATATPGVIACTTALPAATLAAGSTPTPSAIAATATLPDVTESAGATVGPAAVVAVATLPAASVSAGSTVTPATVAATTALPAATLAAGSTTTPAAVAAVAALPAATADTGASATATPAAIASTVALPAASPATGWTASPDAVAAAVALPAASAATGATVSPAAVESSVALPLAAAGAAAVATPDAIAAPVTLPAAAVSAGAAPAPATIAAVVSVPLAGQTLGAGPTPDVIAVTVDIPAALAIGAGSAAVTPGVIATVVAIPAVSLATDYSVFPAAIGLTASLPPAVISAASTVLPLSIAATVAFPLVRIRGGIPGSSTPTVTAGRTSTAAVSEGRTSAAAVSASATSAATVGG